MDARPSNPSPSLLEQVVPKLRPFQREALEFATKGKLYDRQRAGTSTGSTNGQPMTSDQTTGRCVASTTKESSTKLLLADEMGLGKTVTSLAIMSYYESEWPLLILCPASLR
jgi:SNF2 family DNA or RNA helicase